MAISSLTCDGTDFPPTVATSGLPIRMRVLVPKVGRYLFIGLQFNNNPRLESCRAQLARRALGNQQSVSSPPANLSKYQPETAGNMPHDR